MTHNIYLYLAIMAAVTYAIRVLPLTLIRRQIRNRFLQSFLYYVPYVTLAVMTFPAIVDATQSPWAGAAALAVGIIAGRAPVFSPCPCCAAPWCSFWSCFLSAESLYHADQLSLLHRYDGLLPRELVADAQRKIVRKHRPVERILHSLLGNAL